MLTACGSNEPIDQTRVTQNRVALQKCRPDIQPCLGGFARVKSGVRTIGDCNFNCGGYSISVFRLVENMGDDTYLNLFEIVLPDDRPKWDMTAVQYARQFVTNK